MFHPPICQSIEIRDALFVDAHVGEGDRFFVNPMHGYQVEVAAALDRLHQHIDAMVHVDLKHDFWILSVWKLVSCVRVVVGVHEFTQHVQAMQLVIHIERGGICIIAKPIYLILNWSV